MSFCEGGLRLPQAEEEGEDLLAAADDGFGVCDTFGEVVAIVLDFVGVPVSLDKADVVSTEVALAVPQSSQVRNIFFASPQCSNVQAEHDQDVLSSLVGAVEVEVRFFVHRDSSVVFFLE